MNDHPDRTLSKLKYFENEKIPRKIIRACREQKSFKTTYLL